MTLRTQKYLNDKAAAARELYEAGKIDMDELLRVCIDAESGKDTGPIVYLPESEWRRARLAVLRAKELNRRRATQEKKGGL